MEILSYSAAVFIGFLLGLLGGGGSILAVPIFVYLFDINPVLATGYSLFVVGITSLTATLKNLKFNLVTKDAVYYFGIPSIVTIFLTRSYLIPFLPDELIKFDSFIVTKDLLIMIVFALIMFLASISMIKNNLKNGEVGERNIPALILQGAAVGIVAGFVGAGGGFLIVPALIFFSKLGVKEAIASSLAIIALNSLFGFTGELIAGTLIDWGFLSLFTTLSIFGIILGTYSSRLVSQSRLKKAFGYFVLIMSLLILYKEIFNI